MPKLAKVYIQLTASNWKGREKYWKPKKRNANSFLLSFEGHLFYYLKIQPACLQLYNKFYFNAVRITFPQWLMTDVQLCSCYWVGSAKQLPKAIGKTKRKNNANSQLGGLWGVGGERFGHLQIIANLVLFWREKNTFKFLTNFLSHNYSLEPIGHCINYHMFPTLDKPGPCPSAARNF